MPKLTSALPADLESAPDKDAPANTDRTVDSFAWDTFVALNWPTKPDGDGEPDASQLPGQNGDNPTVWETWPEASQIFLPDGRAPAAWGSPPEAGNWPAELRELPPGTRVLTRTGKQISALAIGSPSGPLIDQNGRHVRIEARVNRPVFDFIVARGLYRRDGQTGAEPIAFPAGDPADPVGAPGSIRLQAAWKILSPSEVAAGRFHSVSAVVYTPPPSPASTDGGTIEHAIVGLVGLHIARKTPSAPDWIWATFEHVDNCPTVGEPADRAAYNFYDKSPTAPPPNQPPTPPLNPAAVEPPSKRSQIVRQRPIPQATRAINAAYQAAFRSLNPASPWQYYELVGTQHRLAQESASAPPLPLANTTLEAFLATTPIPSASCIDCHARASTPSGAPADFSFLLHLAR